MGKKMTLSQKRWQRIDAALQWYDPNQLRTFFSASAKFLINPKSWDDSPPRTDFDDNLIIQDFHRGFGSFSADTMRGGRDGASVEHTNLVSLLRSASDWNGGVLSLKRRKKRLTMLRKQMAKRFKKYIRVDKPCQGLVLYATVIKRKYMSKGS